MLVNIETINFKSHPTFTQAHDIQTIMQPITAYGIKHFSYQRLDADGGMIDLASDANVEELFIKHKLYQQCLCGAYDQYTPGYYLGDFIEFDPEFKKLLHTKNLGHYLFIIKCHPKNTEIFAFGTSNKNPGMNHFYLNNLNLFEQFILLFKDKALNLIENYQTQRLFIPNGNDLSNLATKNFTEQFTLKIEHPYSKLLTHREKECLEYLKQGYNAKMIAKHLNISHRTVEHHLAHIREKLKISSTKNIIFGTK